MIQYALELLETPRFRADLGVNELGDAAQPWQMDNRRKTMIAGAFRSRWIGFAGSSSLTLWIPAAPISPARGALGREEGTPAGVIGRAAPLKIRILTFTSAVDQ